MQEQVLLVNNNRKQKEEKEMDKETKPTQEELLKAVADVIDEALVEYDELTKTGQGIDYAQAIDDKKGDGPKASGPDGSTGEGSGAADNSGGGAMVKEDDEDKDKDKKKESDEDLKRSYAALVSKMEERGLISKVQKSEEAPKAAEVVATIVAPAPDTSAVDALRKSYDEKFEAFGKTLGAIGESVKKIAAQPAAPRKGLTGAKPLRKSDSDEGAPSLKKSEVVDKLLDLKKSGDKRLEGAGGSSLINRVETNRMVQTDVERIKGILGV